MNRECKKWLLASTAGTGLLVAAMGAAQWVLPDDPGQLSRYALIKLVGVITGVITLSGGMLFIDYITPDDWMDLIGKNETASSLVMCAVILALSAIVCWS